MKSILRQEYRIYCDLLRELREDADLRQIGLAEKLGVPQAYVSAYEMGKVRLDFVQIRDWCDACSSSFAQFVDLFETVWGLTEAERLARAQQRDARRKAEARAKRKTAKKAIQPLQEDRPQGETPGRPAGAEPGKQEQVVPGGVLPLAPTNVARPPAGRAGHLRAASAAQAGTPGQPPAVPAPIRVPPARAGGAAVTGSGKSARNGGAASRGTAVSNKGVAPPPRDRAPPAPPLPAKAKKPPAPKKQRSPEEIRAAEKRRRGFVR